MRDSTTFLVFDSRMRRVKRRRQLVKVLVAVLVTGVVVAAIVRLTT